MFFLSHSVTSCCLCHINATVWRIVSKLILHVVPLSGGSIWDWNGQCFREGGKSRYLVRYFLVLLFMSFRLTYSVMFQVFFYFLFILFFYMSKSCTLFSMPNIFFCIISTWKYQVPVCLFCWNSCQPGSASGFVHSELLGYIERGVHFITQALTFESLLCHCLIKLWSLCALFGAGVNVTLL